MGKDTRPQKALSRADRSRLAKDTINTTIPALLKSTPRAKTGISNAQLLIEPDLPKRAPSDCAKPTVSVVDSDTLEAARVMHSAHPSDRIMVLSMASPLRAGGGILTGATSQEESLCIRSTLLPSLRDEFYRIPEDAVIYTPDVLVFRDQNLVDLPKSERFFVDVCSCPALRFPEVENGRYAVEADREMMLRKIRMIMRAAAGKGCKRLVLGALGCGAYTNPVGEVAEMFGRVIHGNPKSRKEEESWVGLEEIVFAIRGAGSHSKMQAFREVFGVEGG